MGWGPIQLGPSRTSLNISRGLGPVQTGQGVGAGVLYRSRGGPRPRPCTEEGPGMGPYTKGFPVCDAWAELEVDKITINLISWFATVLIKLYYKKQTRT